MTPVVSIGAPSWELQESYGRIARELTDHFRGCGYHVNELGSFKRAFDYIPVLGGILLGWPTSFDQWGDLTWDGPRLAVTMFESTKLPPGWVDWLNQCDAIVVPSEWLVNVFVDAGVNRPIYVFPLGISPKFRESFRYRFIDDGDPFRVMAIADRGARKGWVEAAHAFQIAFGESADFEFTLKSRDGALPFHFSNPNFRVVSQDMSDKELAQLYAKHHVLLFPTKGEGFGLPPREFAATGGLALATRWGGTKDGILAWGKPIEPDGTEPAWRGDDELKDCGDWAKIDPYAVGEQLANVYRDRHHLFSARQSIQRADAAVALYDWKQFSSSVLSLWERIVKEWEDARQRNPENAIS